MEYVLLAAATLRCRHYAGKHDAVRSIQTTVFRTNHAMHGTHGAMQSTHDAVHGTH